MNIMELIARQLHNLLLKNKKTIAVAESCTGGILSDMLTRIPGSSGYFMLGIVCYSNKSKEKVLRIPAPFIAEYGAVSAKVACRMARNIKKLAGTGLGIGITGIAGPAGATPKKPEGTVFIAVSGRNKTICKKFLFSGNRLAIRKKAALKSLELLKSVIME